MRMKKVEVDFYPSEGEEGADDNKVSDPMAKRTAKMYDLMVPAGMKIKAYTR